MRKIGGQGLREGGSGGISYRRLKGPERVQVSTLSFFPSSFFGQKIGLNLSEDLFFCSSPNFGQKFALNLSEDLLFFALHLILGKKSEKIFCASLVSGRNMILGHALSGPNKIWGPGIDLRTPWKNFSLKAV